MSYRLKLLGGAAIEGEDGLLTGRVARRHPLALLALLSTAPSCTLSRDRAIGLLWPELSQRRARGRLRATLHLVRKALGSGAVLSVGDDLRLEPEVVGADVVAFEAALEAEERERAVALYGGPFLDGFYVDGAGAFERWAEGERRRLAVRYAEALEGLALEAREAGEPRAAAGWWRRLASERPLSARAAVGWMEALAAAGERAEALAAAERHERRLREELGAEPNPEVAALAARLREDPASIPVVRNDRRPVAEGPESPTREGAAGDSASDLSAPAHPPTAAPGGGETVSAAASIRGAGPPASPVGSVTEAGRKRDRSSLRPWAAAGLAAGALVIVVAVAGFLGPEAESADPSSAGDQDRVVVLPLENRTGDEELDHLGTMAADWIAQGLQRTAVLQALGPLAVGRGSELGGEGGAGRLDDGLAEVARETGAGTMVWGSFYGDSAGIHFQAHATRVATGELLGPLPAVRASPEAPMEAVDRLAKSVMGLLAARMDPRLAEWAEAAPRPPSYDAYREFLAALDADDGEAWLGHLRRAWELDTTFVLPLFEALETVAWPMNESEFGTLGDTLLALLSARRRQLSPAEAHWLEALRAKRRSDVHGYYRSMRKAARIAPHMLSRAAAGAFYAGHYREAAAILERPDLPLLLHYNWKQLTAALHFLGEHERELEAARRARAEDSGSLSRMEMEVTALAALGRIDELEEVVEAARTTGGRPSFPAYVIRVAGIELLWHGQPERARPLLEEADRELEEKLRGDLPPSIRRSYRWRRAQTLLFLERFAEAAALAEEEIARRGGCSASGWCAALGVAAAGMGDLERVDEVRGRLSLEANSGRDATWSLARIAAQLGECERAGELIRSSLRKGHPHFFIHRRFGLIECREHPAFLEVARPPGVDGVRAPP